MFSWTDGKRLTIRKRSQNVWIHRWLISCSCRRTVRVSINLFTYVALLLVSNIWSAKRQTVFRLNLTSTLRIMSNSSRSYICNSSTNLVLFLTLPLWALRWSFFTPWMVTRRMHDVTPVVLTFPSGSSTCCGYFYRREQRTRFALKYLRKRWGNSFTALDRIFFSPCYFAV